MLRTEIETKVKAIVGAMCRRDSASVRLEETFDELCSGDEFAMLIVSLNEAFSIEIPVDDAAEIVTVADAINCISAIVTEDADAPTLESFVEDLSAFASADEIRDAAASVLDATHRTKAAALNSITAALIAAKPNNVIELLENILSECYADTLKNWCRQCLEVTPNNKDKAIEILVEFYSSSSENDEGKDAEAERGSNGDGANSPLGWPADLHENEILVLAWAKLSWPIGLNDIKKARRAYSMLAHPDRQPGQAAGDTMVRFNDGCDRLEHRIARC